MSKIHPFRIIMQAKAHKVLRFWRDKGLSAPDTLSHYEVLSTPLQSPALHP